MKINNVRQNKEKIIRMQNNFMREEKRIADLVDELKDLLEGEPDYKNMAYLSENLANFCRQANHNKKILNSLVY